MKIQFKTRNVEKLCTNLKTANKKLPKKVAIDLFKKITFIKNASSLEAVINYRNCRFHQLEGQRNRQYAVDVGGKRSGYRLICSFEGVNIEDEYRNDVFRYAEYIMEILILEVVNHYE